MSAGGQETFDFDRVSFDAKEAEKQKEIGLDKVAFSRRGLLDMARLFAVRIARQRGQVTYDDVFAEMLREGLDPTALGNAAGCVFRGEHFRFTGRWEKSQRVSNHARMNRVWTLNTEAKKPPQRVSGN